MGQRGRVWPISPQNAIPQKPWEVHHAIVKTKRGKAPGPDGVSNDLLRDAGEAMSTKLAELFNKCLLQCQVPEEWNNAIIILLHKKGDPKDINNYRPISLLCCVYQIFTKIITNRITKQLDESQPREQAGFRKHFSTIDHLHTVDQVIEKTNEFKIPLTAGLVDFYKAFDSVEVEDVMAALHEQGIDPIYTNILNHIYTYAKSFIRLHEDSETFAVKRGVRQGDTSSPKLFTACLEKAFRCLDWSGKGLRVDGECLSHLRFADDIIIFANNKTELRKMLEELDAACSRVGLNINMSKTKVMNNDFVEDAGEEIKINNKVIEDVDYYVYLGQSHIENLIERGRDKKTHSSRMAGLRKSQFHF